MNFGTQPFMYESPKGFKAFDQSPKARKSRRRASATPWMEGMTPVRPEPPPAVSLVPGMPADLSFPKDAVAHYVGSYGGPSVFHDNGACEQGVKVLVTDTSRPVVLLLSTYEELTWDIEYAPGVQLAGVVIVSTTERKYRTRDPSVKVWGPNRQEAQRMSISYKVENRLEYAYLVQKVRNVLGVPLGTAQWDYRGKEFVVDGRRSVAFAALSPEGDRLDERVWLIMNDVVNKAASGLKVTHVTGAGATRYWTNTGRSSGKYYLEAEFIPCPGDDSELGWVDFWVLPESVSKYNGFHMPDTNMHLGVKVDKLYKKGGVIGLALDMDTHYAYWSFNGNWVNGNPMQQVGGVPLVHDRYYPVLAVDKCKRSDADSTNRSWMLNFGKSKFRYPLPKGYKPYDQSKN